jgi:serine/threonine-protein kinase 11
VDREAKAMRLTNKSSPSLLLSYNITTGLYPFEGCNIYRLLENIGKCEWTPSDTLESKLRDLVLNMLQKDPAKRFTIQQIRNHSWFKCVPFGSGPPVPIPPLKGDHLRCSTVLPYLEAYHYDGDRDASDMYFTEHDLKGEWTPLRLCLILICCLVSPFTEEIIQEDEIGGYNDDEFAIGPQPPQSLLAPPGHDMAGGGAQRSHQQKSTITNSSSNCSNNNHSSSSSSHKKRSKLKSVSCISVKKFSHCRPS